MNSAPETRTAIVREYDEELINKFPNLFVRPEDPEERTAAEQRFDILLGERERLRMLFHALGRARRQTLKAHGGKMPPAELREADWRALHEYYADVYDLTPETYERDKRLFQE